jgi:succinate-semialdehyde dehydrogenase/glutarate-semialdehyde dehydrogenase
MSVAIQRIRVIDPASGEDLAGYDAHSPEQIDEALAQAHAAYRDWRRTAPEERRTLLLAAAELLRAEREEHAQLITAEMGKPLTEALAEIDKSVLGCEFYAAEAERLLADEPVQTGARASFVAYEPIGVVLAVMPWNYPFWQVLRFAAPALMAGNAAVLKHSPNVSGCALAIEDVLRRAGFPDGLFRALLVGEADVASVTERLIDDPRVAAVTLTGSERAGAAVGAAAGRAIKKTVLELGGSDPFIVLADADVSLAAEQAARGRFQNGGQACIAAKRFLVDASVADEFERRFVDAVEALEIGDPRDPATRIGPMARADLLDAVERQVGESVAAGARVLTGGRRLERPGYYFAPTVLADVTTEMPVFREETFGPVAAIMRFADEAEAIALANDTRYGLGASIWTRDLERARRLGREIESGALFVNAIVASDPRLPFGGTKRSGVGRELGAAGPREFTNVRTYWIADSPAGGAGGPPVPVAE